MEAQDWGVLILLSILWGGSFFFLEVLLKTLPPFTIILARVGFAGLLMLAMLYVTGKHMPWGGKLWASFFTLAALNNAIPFILFAFAQQHITSALSSILNATTPLWGVIVAHFFTTDERASAAKIVGVALGMMGVVVMIGGDALKGLGSNVLAQMACLVATLCYALASVYARRYKAQGVGPFELSTGQLMAAAAMLLPFSLLIDKPWTLPMPGATAIWSMAGFVILSTTIAYFLYFRLLNRTGAVNSTLVTFLIPVTAIMLGVMFLGEHLEAKHVTGMALIALGLAAIDGRPWRWITRN